MTSHNVGGVCESMKNGCARELQAKNFNDQLTNSDSYHAERSAQRTMFHELNRRTNSVNVDSVVRRSTSSSCTPHSIEDILRRPRRVHVTSLLLPESRRTSGPVAQGRLYSWPTRSSDEVQTLAQRTEDDDLTWKPLYWAQHSPRSQAQWTTATPTTRGRPTADVMTIMIINFLTLRTWTLSITVDNILMLNCYSTLWSDRVRRFEKKFAECDNIFLQKFQSQFDSLYLSLS